MNRAEICAVDVDELDVPFHTSVATVCCRNLGRCISCNRIKKMRLE